ncbi:hypothetical protein ACTMU2_04850 [Cupriavidus basilensis]
MAQGQRELLALNAQVVRATRHKQFAEHVRASSLSATMLDADGKAFKKQYATGRRELEHEFGKSMRHRSIRDLSDDETGIVINDLKPIWLMSPLSVSDTLPLSADLFDVVVIFDEASQIPTEEAVPALSRARQVVVVGDDDAAAADEFLYGRRRRGGRRNRRGGRGRRIAINLDSDSLLNQAARNLPATLLAWHYRSRHESLISFSNAAFYDGRLVTIPDRALEQAEDEAPPLRSDREDAGIAGTDALLARPVSFHWLADGVYADRRNAPEAAYIARTVREMLRRETRLSLGIGGVFRGAAGRHRVSARRVGRRRRGLRDAARARVRARGRRPVQRTVYQEPGKRAGRRARRDHPEHLLRAGARRQDADELRSDQPAWRREAPER